MHRILEEAPKAVVLGLIAVLLMAAQAAAGQWLQVGEARRLYLDCEGQGSPTIVLEAGFGDDGTPWGPVKSALAASHRVCAYDRAGMGRSESSSRPSTAANIVDDLHGLVRKAGIATPFVLVAHSRGGLYATLYSLIYRSEVAGLVLVDPSFAEQDVESAAISQGQADRIAASIPKTRERYRRCEALARAVALTVDSPQGCFSVSSSGPQALRDETLRQSLRPDYYGTLSSEFDAIMARVGYGAITDRAKAQPHPLGSLSLVVLTAGTPHQQGGPSAQDDVAASLVWSRGHDRLAAYSTAGRSITVPKSGHYIQLDQPAAVIDAVNSVLAACCARP